ncbi:hypothetical protein M5K25_000225 [Dendrobium thyrsiflorum]|uniref:Uncharacterized protein n=1 Tax=Dendrobium thyrsiflorum TaxID=117978 RepID=A0ABD0W9S8_DENTH
MSKCHTDETSKNCCVTQASVFNCCGAISRPLQCSALSRSALGCLGTQHWGTQGSVRKKSCSRMTQRKSKEERMVQAEFQRKEELKHLKNLKKKEI